MTPLCHLLGYVDAGPTSLAGCATLFTRPHLARDIAATRIFCRYRQSVSKCAPARPAAESLPVRFQTTPSLRTRRCSRRLQRLSACAGNDQWTVTFPNGSPIAGVVMRLTGRRLTDHTDSNGFYRLENVTTPTPTRQTRPRALCFTPEFLSSTLPQQNGCVLTGVTSSAVDANPIDMPEYFVRQHYLIS